MAFDPRLAEVRFGYGLSPRIGAPRDIDMMLSRLAGPDRMAQQLPLKGFADLLPRIAEYRRLTAEKKKPGMDQGSMARDAVQRLRQTARAERMHAVMAGLYRAAGAEDALRERLARFWADHFTVRGKNALLRGLEYSYVEEAIRPHLTGRFSDLLKSAVTHPIMLHYLDQSRSVGPNSPAAKGRQGLNENLAREVLELHTLGVDGPYTQADVRQLAELFTGLSLSSEQSFIYRPGRAEPGAETVLGRRYGGARPALGDIHAALDDLAIHPATAAHIATKLVVHFVADHPDPALVAAVQQAYQSTGGDLTACYRALLDHPLAWAQPLQKARQPFDFIAASLRALDAPMPRDSKAPLRYFARYLSRMGQPAEGPPGPDGWAEDAGHWITPQGMAARIQWAAKVPSSLVADLPDPRLFAEAALGGAVSEDLQFAAAAAENRPVGIALVLASPAFQRR